MVKKLKLSDSDQIKAFYEHLDHPLKQVMEALHKIILETDPTIGEHIKWNAPAFYYTEEMAPFDPKEYKRDIVVMNFHKKDVILLVFPTGSRIVDTSGFLEGKYSDGRKIAQIKSMTDLVANEKNIKSVILQWLAQIDK